MSLPRSSSGRRTKEGGKGSKSAREWIVRGLLAAGALVCAGFSISSALANVLLRADAERAHALAPGDGRVIAAYAQQSFSATPDSNADSRQAFLALKALSQDSTAVDALNVLAMQAQLRSEDALVDRLFSYSFALSRRELQPQIWTIEKAVERGDIHQALRNYDRALRTSRNARQTLFPVLTSALSEPRIRDEVISLLKEGPVWGQEFLGHASGRGRDAVAIARFLEEGSVRGLGIEDTHRARVVIALIAQNLTEEAWNFYKGFRVGAEVDRSRDPNFDQGIETPTLFDWTVGRAPGLSAAIVQGESGGFLDFAVPGGTRADVVSQTQLLPPGTYRIEGVSALIDQPERSQPYWALTCRAGAEIGRVNVPNSQEQGGRFSGELTVPSGCPVQTLALTLRASDRASGVSGQIERLRLVPTVLRVR